MAVTNFYKILGVTLSLFVVCGTASAENDNIVITHNAISPVSTGNQIDISASISDPHNNVDLVRIYFKTTENGRAYFVVMEKNQNNNYTGSLPAPLYGSSSLEYVILARTESDQIIKSQQYVIEVIGINTVAHLD